MVYEPESYYCGVRMNAVHHVKASGADNGETNDIYWYIVYDIYLFISKVSRRQMLRICSFSKRENLIMGCKHCHLYNRIGEVQRDIEDIHF